MGGIFGTISKKSCVADLFYGTDYNSHLGTRRGGLATYSSEKGFVRSIHNLESSYFRTKFEPTLDKFEGATSGIGVISDTDAQPLIMNSHLGRFAICTVAKILNKDELTQHLLDKNMAEAEKLFANLSDIHELDDISYLTEEQKMLIKKFFSNFNDDHNSELKKRFLQLWNHFLDIYQQFNQRLEEQGLAYEGALYRKVVNDENIKFQHKKYLFVGFNMMQVVEQKLCERLMKEGKAHFYWDYDDYYMQNNHEAGHYIREYLKYFPNELNDMPPHDLREIYHNFDNDKDITYISASTENIQARYVNQWLKEKKRYKCGKKVAIVLADEGLLQSVIHSLPTNEDIKSLPDYSENDQLSYNITLGYPLQQTPFYSLLQHLIKLQGIGHPKHSNNYRLHYVLMALRHPYTLYISQNYSKLLSALDEQKQFYPTRQFLSMDGDEGLSLLFKDLGETATENEYNLRLIQYLLEILKTIGVNSKEQDDPLFQESLFRTYTLLNRLQELIQTGDLAVDCITLERLMQQLIQSHFRRSNISQLLSQPLSNRRSSRNSQLHQLELSSIKFYKFFINGCLVKDIIPN